MYMGECTLVRARWSRTIFSKEKDVKSEKKEIERYDNHCHLQLDINKDTGKSYFHDLVSVLW